MSYITLTAGLSLCEQVLKLPLVSWCWVIAQWLYGVLLGGHLELSLDMRSNSSSLALLRIK